MSPPPGQRSPVPVSRAVSSPPTVAATDSSLLAVARRKAQRLRAARARRGAVVSGDARVGSGTMRAIRQWELGGPDVLRLVDCPRPIPAPTEVLVRVTAAGVNPLDWKTRSRGVFLGPPPFTVGADVAGVVAAVSEGVTRFSVGDRVFGMPRFPHEAAAYAEYVTAPSRQLAHTPERLSDVEAAALPMAALTAWQALVETADVRPGQRVLVHGEAGGIASSPSRSPRRAAPT